MITTGFMNYKNFKELIDASPRFKQKYDTVRLEQYYDVSDAGNTDAETFADTTIADALAENISYFESDEYEDNCIFAIRYNDTEVTIIVKEQ